MRMIFLRKKYLFIGKPMKTPDDKASGSREGTKRKKKNFCPKMLAQNVLWLLHTHRLCTR